MIKRVALALAAAGLGGLALAAPASATTDGVEPLLDCYQSKTTSSVKVVWGYENHNRTAVAPNAYWKSVAAYYKTTLPQTFAVGEHHGVGVASVDRKEYDSWGVNLKDCAAAGVSLPANGNGLAVVGLVLALGAGGAVVARRASKGTKEA